MNVVIFGSCVTRDALEYVNHQVCVLQKYFARSSLGSAYAEKPALGFNAAGISSAFQRGVVQADLAKEFPRYLETHQFDLLIYDPIDERFDMLETQDQALCTLSNELAQTGARDLAIVSRSIRSGSEEFYLQWEQGWQALIAQLDKLGKRSSLLINKVFWSETTDAGSDYMPTYHQVHIRSANAFLCRLYLRIEQDLEPDQILSFEPALLTGAIEHKWGRSPFHFVESYYVRLAEEIMRFGQRPRVRSGFQRHAEASVAGRAVTSVMALGVEDGQLVEGSNGRPSVAKFTSNGEVQIRAEEALGQFAGEAGVFELRLNLGRPAENVNGLSVCYRLSGWEQLSYLAIGYTAEGAFHHVKITNPAFDKWVESAICNNDLIFGLQSHWKPARPPEKIADLRLYVKGKPGDDGAQIVYRWSGVWRELEPKAEDLFSCNEPKHGFHGRPPSEVIDAIARYVRKCNPYLDEHVRDYLDNGALPLTGDKSLHWPIDATLPEQFGEVGTYRYIWHAMHPALSLMVFGREMNHLGAIFAARDYVSSWLERSFYSPDADIKFAWYDHGTAERLLALLLMHELGHQYSFDFRFMARLRLAILRHGLLLESEAFYASHQGSRYHNHAWFQDIALIAAAQLMTGFPGASRWLQRGIDRLTDQLDKLIVRDRGYAIFVENSIGYHQGVQRLVEFAGELVSFNGNGSAIALVAQELQAWSSYLRYPDGRAPSQGDTFRRANAEATNLSSGKAYSNPECLVLPKAGYAVVKGNHDQFPFMVCMFATSLCKTHKHEDNLSFTLFFDGIEWLIDPSFFSHDYTSPVPAHLRGAWGHSNLTLGGLNYSLEPGCASLNGVSDSGSFALQGTHTAYEGFEVTRTIAGSLQELRFSIADRVCSISDEVPDRSYSLLQCGEYVTARLVEGGVELSHPASRFRLRLTTCLHATIHKGWSDTSVLRGVAGNGFMEKKDTTLVAFALEKATEATIECFVVREA